MTITVAFRNFTNAPKRLAGLPIHKRAASGSTALQQNIVYVSIGHVLRDYRIFPTKAKVVPVHLRTGHKDPEG